MCRIVAELGTLPHRDQKALQHDLRDVAEDFLTAVLTTPFGVPLGPPDVPLSKRERWIVRHLAKPANDLIDALSDENAPMRSGWPDLLEFEGPDRRLLLGELKKLREYAISLSNNFYQRSQTVPRSGAGRRGKSSRGANHTQELRIDLADALHNILMEYYPDILISRGTYDPEFGMTGKFREVMGICFMEIIQDRISDHLLQELLRSLNP